MKTNDMWWPVGQACRQFRPTGDAGRDGFDLARTAHGLLAQNGVDPRSIRPVAAGKELARLLLAHCPHDTAGIPEMAAAAWHSVKVPEGFCPIGWAATLLRWAGRPKKAPGRYTTPAQHDLASAIFFILDHLPVQGGEVYAAVRPLGHHLGVNKDVVAATINLMVQNGAITRVYKGNTHRAARFLPPSQKTEDTEASHVTDVGERLKAANSSPDATCRSTAPTDEQHAHLDALFG